MNSFRASWASSDVVVRSDDGFTFKHYQRSEIDFSILISQTNQRFRFFDKSNKGIAIIAEQTGARFRSYFYFRSNPINYSIIIIRCSSEIFDRRSPVIIRACGASKQNKCIWRLNAWPHVRFIQSNCSWRCYSSERHSRTESILRAVNWLLRAANYIFNWILFARRVFSLIVSEMQMLYFSFDLIYFFQKSLLQIPQWWTVEIFLIIILFPKLKSRKTPRLYERFAWFGALAEKQLQSEDDGNVNIQHFR